MKKVITAVLFALLMLANSSFGQNNAGLQLGLNFPMGDFSNISGTGFGFAGTYEYMVMPQLGLTGSIGYYHFGSKSVAEGFGLSVETSTSVVPIVVGGRYYFMKGEIMPYGGAELGLYILSASADISGNFTGFLKISSGNTVERTNATNSSSNSTTNFGFAPFVGVRYSIAPNISLDGNLKFTIVTTSGSTTTYFGINAGAFYAF